MAQSPRNLPHLRIEGGGETERYTRPPRKIDPKDLPKRDRYQHADALAAAIGEAIAAGRREVAAREDGIAVGTPGFYLEVEVPAKEMAAIDTLGNRTKHIEVVTVRTGEEGAPIEATVFVPTTAEAYYTNGLKH